MPDVANVVEFTSNYFGHRADNIERVRAGGNNKSWIATIQGKQYFVKQYFTSPSDPRDRLRNEYQFLNYAHQIVPNSVASPITICDSERIAIYEYLVGCPIDAEQITIEHVLDAATFFASINSQERFTKAQHLGFASEACFSIEQHIQVVDSRLSMISESIDTDSNVHAKSIVHEIRALWRIERESLIHMLKTQNLDLVNLLPKSDWCVSPSDFGFHNALQTNDGIKFVDFEYAGWDDPAKMAGDFFSQLSVPVDPRFFAQFADVAFAPFNNSQAIRMRAQLLMILYRFKWCCIALNVFIPSSLQRRIFADPHVDPEKLKAIQLQKARNIIDELERYRVLH